jgi:hypothetical protein
MKLTNALSRHTFLKSAMMGVSGMLLPSVVRSEKLVQDKPAPIKLEIVKEFVTVAHGNIDRLKEMLENDHLLLHVSNDWGGGDYESAIEAAGHVGNKDIAKYLMAKGARYNIYLACMLGHLDIVKQVTTQNPNLINSKGPHGFTMLHHAQKGGDDAIAVAEYLKSIGAKETKIDFYARA